VFNFQFYFKKKLSAQNPTTIYHSTHTDWQKYKKEQNIEDDLRDATDAGKGIKPGVGFLAKQKFLRDVDDRQFEIEMTLRKEERMRNSKKKG
jgi:hypothetical protein